MNMVIMPCSLTTLEANLSASYAQALGQIRFDEDA
jgi:3-polyprenyl-4-hydroxybenzoate decarboxylase